MEINYSKAIEISELAAKGMHTVAHDFGHADRVRRNALDIASYEGADRQDLFIVELASLWHDVGLDYVQDRHLHPHKSADLFKEKIGDSCGLSVSQVNLF